MKRCDHSQWLSICRKTTLLQSDRLHRLTNDLPYPDEQQPSLLVFLGSKEKSRAIRALFGIKRARRFTINQKSSGIYLHHDSSTNFVDRPIFVAHCDLDPHRQKPCDVKDEKCHEMTKYHLRQQPVGDRTVDELLTHLLFPFAEVFCFFSADLGGFREIAKHLARWLERGHSSTLPKSALPSVLIITDDFSPKVGAEEQAKKAFLWLLEEETSKDPYTQFSTIDIVALFPKDTISADARYMRVKDRLIERAYLTRKNRKDDRLSFSATQFLALFEAASKNFAESLNQPFDFIQASRVHNPVAPDLDEHLVNFLEHIDSVDQLKDFAAPMIASSILLDSYPPDAHGEYASSFACANILTPGTSVRLLGDICNDLPTSLT
jgi:hypothetical protein